VQAFAQGRVIARLATGSAEVERAQALRHLAFHAGKGGGGGDGTGRDADRFDAVAEHVLVLDRATDALLCCFRVLGFQGADIGNSYAAQFYDLTPLADFPGRTLELGRFCLHPGCHDPDVLRLAWAAVARLVDRGGVTLLFGCTSFPGADPARHAAALGALARHVAPARWLPRRRAPEIVDLAGCVGQHTARQALAAMPALLRTYLGMGAWVSDHAVVDRQMDTLHVLTGVEIATIPPGRVRALRAIGAKQMG
jgi:putative hemolysin